MPRTAELAISLYQARSKLVMAVTATFIGSVVFVVLNNAILSQLGVRTSLPAQAIILFASSLSSIAGFAFSAI